MIIACILEVLPIIAIFGIIGLIGIYFGRLNKEEK